MTERIRAVDLHTHTSVSDGSDTPEQLLANVIAAGIAVFSVTDHDAVKACGIIRGLLHDGSPAFIPGVEFSCRDENGKYHILGYGFDPDAAPILKIVSYGHGLRMKKTLARLEYLKNEYGFSFPDDEISRLLSLDNPGKPHLGNLMVKYGYAENRVSAISDYLDRLVIPDAYVRPEEAIGGILAAGGVPVLAHPFYGSGDELIFGPEMEKRLGRLKEYGLAGIEAYYSGFPAKLRGEAISLADRFDLLITAGSDYHGTNKLVRLGDTGLDAEGEKLPRFRRFLSRFGFA